jgi:hypothetical protein
MALMIEEEKAIAFEDQALVQGSSLRRRSLKSSPFRNGSFKILNRPSVFWFYLNPAALTFLVFRLHKLLLALFGNAKKNNIIRIKELYWN